MKAVIVTGSGEGGEQTDVKAKAGCWVQAIPGYVVLGFLGGFICFFFWRCTGCEFEEQLMGVKMGVSRRG